VESGVKPAGVEMVEESAGVEVVDVEMAFSPTV
jgi:hypothetical protein